VALLTLPAAAQEPASLGNTVAAIDHLIGSIYAPDAPGAAIIVVKDGQVLLRKAYGLANVELNVPLRPDSVMAIASLSKQFTAAAILKLVEQRKMALDDDITRFLPSYPTHGARITVEHLLTHTSGISGLSETSDLRATTASDGKVIDLAADWVRDLPADAAPGERWAYSNWGYNLLATIVEQVSGKSYADFLDEQIFGPLGMTHTFYTDRRRVIPLRAVGYDTSGDTVMNVLPSRSRAYHPSGAGGLLSTVDDLATWNDALSRGRVLSRASLDRMFTPYRLNDGTSTGYGYGWDIGEYEGHPVHEHAGGVSGFQSFVVRIPDANLYVAILSNGTPMTAPLQATAHRVAALALGRPIPEPQGISVPPGTLEGLVGTFRGSDVGTFATLREGDRLVAEVPGFSRMPLVMVAPMTFRSPLVTWTFTFDADAGSRAVRVRIRDWKLNDVAERTESVAPTTRPIVTLTTAQLDAITGEYESLNGVLVRVTRVADHLVVQPAGQTDIDIFPVAASEFVTKEGDVQYAFVLDGGGAVRGYTRAAAGGRPVPARRLFP